MSEIATALRTLATEATRLADASTALADEPDDALLELQAAVGIPRERLHSFEAQLAGEISRRSIRRLGHSGLAQRHGFVSPAALVQSLGHRPRREAARLVRIGDMLSASPSTAGDGAGPRPTDKDAHPVSGLSPTSDVVEARPWLGAVVRAVAEGELSVDAADALQRGLGDTADAHTARALLSATDSLLRTAESTDPDALYRRAREARDDIEATAVADRHARQRERRYLRLWRMDDGSVRLSALLDAESGEAITCAIDSVLAPRRGPRFVARHDESAAHTLRAASDAGATPRPEHGPARTARPGHLSPNPRSGEADSLTDGQDTRTDETGSRINEPDSRTGEPDSRTNEQVAVDALVQMVDIAARADEGRVFAAQRPAVRLIAFERDLRDDRGHAVMERTGDAIPRSVTARHVCNAGTIRVVIDDTGQSIDLGRSRRLFSTRQRIALAVRDGGCRWPGCDRPPSWCEAHHIEQWHAEHGKTDLADGILLCRHHHMLLHNNGWRISRQRGGNGDSDAASVAPDRLYLLHPPESIDPEQRCRPLPTKNGPLRRRLISQPEGAG